jgi:MFS family permease
METVEERIYRRRWLTMLTLVSGLIVVIIDNTILNVALPSISQQLGASQAQLTGAILSYAVVFGSLQFTAGVLGDRWGRKRIFMIGLVLFGLASLAASQSQTPNQLVGFRALMAIGAAMITPQTLSILTNVFPPAERGRAIAIWAGCTGASLALGPIVGGFLVVDLWWMVAGGWRLVHYGSWMVDGGWRLMMCDDGCWCMLMGDNVR